MCFKNLSLPQVMDTSTNDLIVDFFEPVLSSSVTYDRGVGFFSGAWLHVAAKGMSSFTKNGGRARWVTSPILDEMDMEAILKGEQARADELLKLSLEQTIQNLSVSLEKDHLSALAWMVSDGILDFRIAVPRNKLEKGNFHDKFGIFQDMVGNRICFNGSYNDSVQGLRNYESIKIFWDWDESFKKLVESDAERFEKLWNNEDPNVRTLEMPKAVKEQLIQLRSFPRPYFLPGQEKDNEFRVSQPKLPAIPVNISLRPYQEEAIDAWFDAGCRGLFEMATGTGKTITALAALVRLLNREKRLVMIIACPFKHLVEQWTEEAMKFNLSPIKVFESRKTWEEPLAVQLRLFSREQKEVLCVICSNASFKNQAFLSLIKPFFSQTILVVDEVHTAGAPGLLKAIPDSIPFRLGLSATPFRYYDPEGSGTLIEYFNQVVYKLGLEDAIGTFLTPYFYFPILIPLADDEFLEFAEITEEIQRLLPKRKNEQSHQIPEAAKKLLIKRARIANNSIAKVEWVKERFRPFQDIRYSIFYSGDRIFEEITRLLGLEKKIRIHRFTSKESALARKEILAKFASGELQALVAMKCLDEGVDIPPTRDAYFLASSGNPREFIQRRGRVLRRYPGKEYANIYDLISVPPWDYLKTESSHPLFSSVRSLLKREYRRLSEFAELAENKYVALNEIFDILNELGILGDD